MAGVPLYSIAGTVDVTHHRAEKALVSTWHSMTTPQFREALERGLNECGRLGAPTWIVDLTRSPGVPSQADLAWINTDCVEIGLRNGIRAVIFGLGTSAIAAMGAKRWAKTVSENGLGTYDCKSLADALALAAEVASAKHE